MKRLSGRLCVIVVAVMAAVVIAQVASAQNEEGRRGRAGRGGGGGAGGRMGPPSMAMFAMNPKVQDELKLSDDQKSKVEKISEEGRKAMREQFQSGAFDREKMRKTLDEQTEKLNKVLDDGQQKRLMGIFVQLMGAGAVMDPAVGKEIGLTDDQKSKLREAIGPPPEGGRGGGGGGQSFQERREKMEKEVNSVLTDEQKKKLESLKGEKVDIDPASLRGGRGGGPEGRPRERRNRGGSESTPKKSAA